MKLHHTFGLIVFIGLIIVGIFVLAHPHNTSELTTDPAMNTLQTQLQGVWLGEGMYDDGTNWFMRYTFDDTTYRLETDSTYGEEGTYRISKKYEDGSMEITKTYKEGEKTYAMVIQFKDDNTFILEGLTMHRITE